MPGPDPKKTMTRKEKPSEGLSQSQKKKKKTNVIIMNGKEYELLVPDFGPVDNLQLMSKGGRMGYRMGGKCKLAMKGKGRAYGKNS